MAIAFIAGDVAGSTTGGDVSTAAINSTGANLLVAASGYFVAEPITTVFDSNSNTFTASTVTSSADISARLYHDDSAPTVGSGHTATADAPGTGSNPCVALAAFSGVDALDVGKESGAAAAASTIQPGSLTPSADGALFVIFASGNASVGQPTFSIDSGFSIIDQVAAGFGCVPGMLAYLIQGTAAAVNPTISTGGQATQMTCRMAVFLAEGAGGGSSGGTFGGKLTNSGLIGGGLFQ